MKFPITPLTLPITIRCQSTAPAFLQLGGQGLLAETAVPTAMGLGSRCERKTGDVWGGNVAHCRDREFGQKRSDDVTIIALMRRDIERIFVLVNIYCLSKIRRVFGHTVVQ